MAWYFLLAAVMSVDDTDLLHRAPQADVTDKEMIAHAQKATFDWGMLAQATGGSLKWDKCYAYFYLYRFVQGKATLKRRRNFPQPSAHFVLENRKEAVGPYQDPPAKWIYNLNSD